MTFVPFLLWQCLFFFPLQRPEFAQLCERLKAIGATHVIKEEALRRPEIKEVFKVCGFQDNVRDMTT